MVWLAIFSGDPSLVGDCEEIMVTLGVNQSNVAVVSNIQFFHRSLSSWRPIVFF